MKVAIMQPYFLPYLGYFQLINTADKFVFYDDVTFIKQGWINRNQIKVNNQQTMFTAPVKKASSFELIKDTELHPQLYMKWKKKFLKTLQQAYGKAPYFEQVFPLVRDLLEKDFKIISDLAVESVRMVYTYLELNTEMYISSRSFSDSHGLDRADRIIQITKSLKAQTYVNSPGGQELYSKEYFKNKGVTLYFIEPVLPQYNQLGKEFIPGLSILDILMNNSVKDIRDMLNMSKLK